MLRSLRLISAELPVNIEGEPEQQASLLQIAASFEGFPFLSGFKFDVKLFIVPIRLKILNPSTSELSEHLKSSLNCVQLPANHNSIQPGSSVIAPAERNNTSEEI